jgi:pimeloyl-ACP methyl ester carboxylesterase
MARVIGLKLRSAAALCFLLCLVGCHGEQQPSNATGGAQSPTAENASDPVWIHQNPQHPNRVAIVFVHGIFGDTKGTWTNSNGQSFFDLVHDLAGIGDKVDIYAFGFSSHMLANGSLKIGEAANKLDDYLRKDEVDKYREIVLVAHSMGGLIVMRELVSHPALRAKVPLLVFYATPQEGSQIADIGRYIVKNNPAVRQMLPVNANDYLQQINEDWINVKSTTPHPTMICAYETKPIAGAVIIVPWDSSTRHCDRPASAIEDSDHLSIVKPDRPEHPSVVVLANALNEFVAPTLDAAALDMPSFQKDRDPWAYVITNAGNRNTAVFENRNTVPLFYSLKAQDSTYMLALPPDMPRHVAPGARDAVDLVLLNPLRPEYRLELQIGAAPERIIIARIPNMDAAIAQRNELESATAEHINVYFASGDNKMRFQLLSPEQQQQKLTALAGEAIASRQPGLPLDARLVLTADTLTGLNLSNSAAVALGAVEAQFPATATAASVQRLAGIVSARTGRSDVLKSIRVPSVSVAEAMPPPNLSMRTVAQRRALTQLADNLQEVPAIKAEAGVLKGDVLRASGDQQAAMRVYVEAGTHENTPIVRERLRLRAER